MLIVIETLPEVLFSDVLEKKVSEHHRCSDTAVHLLKKKILLKKLVLKSGDSQGGWLCDRNFKKYLPDIGHCGTAFS